MMKLCAGASAFMKILRVVGIIAVGRAVVIIFGLVAYMTRTHGRQKTMKQNWDSIDFASLKSNQISDSFGVRSANFITLSSCQISATLLGLICWPHKPDAPTGFEFTTLISIFAFQFNTSCALHQFYIQAPLLALALQCIRQSLRLYLAKVRHNLHKTVSLKTVPVHSPLSSSMLGWSVNGFIGHHLARHSA